MPASKKHQDDSNIFGIRNPNLSFGILFCIWRWWESGGPSLWRHPPCCVMLQILKKQRQALVEELELIEFEELMKKSLNSGGWSKSTLWFTVFPPKPPGGFRFFGWSRHPQMPGYPAVHGEENSNFQRKKTYLHTLFGMGGKLPVGL